MKKLLLAIAVIVLGMTVGVFLLRARTNTAVVVRDISGTPFIEISGPLDRAGAKEVVRVLRAAEQSRPTLILISFESPGGDVSSTFAVADVINGLSIPTIGWVKEAFAGTVLLLASVDEIYFAPQGVCGGPVFLMPRGELEGDHATRKIDKHIGRKLKEFADANGHDSDVFLAMADSSTQLVRKAKVWKNKGELMSLTATEAREIGLSKGTIASPEEIVVRHKEKPTQP